LDEYSAEPTKRATAGQADYWDHATRLELAVLARDQAGAEAALAEALAHVREPWEPETTTRNLGLIGDTRRGRGEATAWLDEILKTLGERNHETVLEMASRPAPTPPASG